MEKDISSFLHTGLHSFDLNFLRTSDLWMNAKDMRIFVETDMDYANLARTFRSPHFVRTYYQTRRRSSKDNFIIPIVRSNQIDEELIECGRVCDWKEGIAAQVLSGSYQVSVIIFRVKKNLKEQRKKQKKTKKDIKKENLQSLEIKETEYKTQEKCLDSKEITKELILPNTSSFSSSAASCCVYGSYMSQGNRYYMEDEILTELDMEFLAYKLKSQSTLNSEEESFKRKYPHHMYFAILDGHNGREAVDFVRDFLHHYIVKNPYFPLHLNHAIREAFHAVDQKILENSALNCWESGTTAVSIILSGDRILVAHVGDCRCVLSRNGKAVALTTDHNTHHTEEKNRVEKAGGFVRDGRVGDLVSVTRALGDFDRELGMKIPGLSCEPDVVDYLLQESDEFLILASDGLWEKFQEQHAISFARRSLQRHNDVQKACEELANEALRRQTTDNVAVMLISFHNRKDFNWDKNSNETKSDKASNGRPKFCLSGLKIVQNALQEASS